MPQLALSPNGAWLERLHARGALYELIVQTTTEGVWVIDAEAHTVFVNEQMARLLGRTVQDMLGQHLFAFMDEEGRAVCAQRLQRRKEGVREQHEFRFLRSDGQELWTQLSTSPLLDEVGRYAGALAMVADITPRKEAERRLALAQQQLEQRVAERTQQLVEMTRRLEELAARDSLTGLLNRRALDERLAQEVSRARRHAAPLSALMLDVDHFKQINDSAGHQAGDLVLCQLAGMLRDEVRDSDVVARFGGEEFVILAPHTARAGAIVLAERIRKAALRGASRLWRESVTVSIGVAELKHVPDTAESLLARADGAMYEAKRRGRDRVCG